MTDREILSNAIDKAVNNGYTIQPLKELPDNIVYPTIFSHSFAKAFWGKNLMAWSKAKGYYESTRMSATEAYSDTFRVWQHHLQQMALEKEPIKYLEKFL